VEVLQGESLDSYRDFYVAENKNPDEVILAILNASNEQGGKQGGKGEVRKAIEEGGDVEAAIASHQDQARQFMQGAPRGGGGARHETGLTKKQREDLGTAVVMHQIETGKAPTAAQMRDICEGLGIDPSLLERAA